MAIKIALAGNPNCGKTTMFNALTGANQYVGNWPGVTVEKKEGKLKSKSQSEEVIVTDLPGIYSLSPYTLEEVVSRDYLLKDDPDVIVNLVDATNIERNLYLTTQMIETGIPVVIALNMADLLAKRGIKIDIERLSMLLDCPIVETSALKQTGLDKLIAASYRILGLISYLTAGETETRAWTIVKGTKAPQAAGKIHSDFERGFIRAEVVNYQDLLDCGSYTAAKEKGLVGLEGKEYVVKDGDVILFRFNV